MEVPTAQAAPKPAVRALHPAPPTATGAAPSASMWPLRRCLFQTLLIFLDEVLSGGESRVAVNANVAQCRVRLGDATVVPNLFLTSCALCSISAVGSAAALAAASALE